MKPAFTKLINLNLSLLSPGVKLNDDKFERCYCLLQVCCSETELKIYLCVHTIRYIRFSEFLEPFKCCKLCADVQLCNQIVALLLIVLFLSDRPIEFSW